MNAGGPAYTDPQGRGWAADTNFTGGSTYGDSHPIANTDAEALYQSERYGAFQYQFAVPNGTYQLRLKFAELYFTGPGQRIFNVLINGQTALSNFDVFAQAGGAFRAVDRELPVTTSNGQIVIQFSPLTDNPQISAIEIVPQNGGSGTTITWNTGAPAPIGRMEAQGVVARDPRDNKERLYIFGGFSNDHYEVTLRSDAYDPATDTWTRIADMPEGITHAAVVADGSTIYLVGGYLGHHPGGAIDRVYKYDLINDRWSLGPPLPAVRSAGAAAIVSRNLHFVAGATRTAGTEDDTDQGDHWVLALDGGSTWDRRRSIPTPRNHTIGRTLNGKIYVIGGQNNTNEEFGNLSIVEVYDPSTDSWMVAASMPAPKGQLGATVLDGRIVIVGGTANGLPPSAEVASYNPQTDAWSLLTPIPDGRAAPIVGAIDGRIIVASGADGIEPNGRSDWQASPIVWNGILSNPLVRLQVAPAN